MVTNALNSTHFSKRAVSVAGWSVLLGILLLAATLRFYHLADGLGGYQAHAEANTMLVAESFLTGSRLQADPAVRALWMVPAPSFPLVVYAFIWVPLQPLVVARLIILLAGLAGILLVFDLGRRLFNPGAGGIAAAIFAFAPIDMVLGRNAQAETLAMTLMLLAHWILVRSNPDPESSPAQGIRHAGLVLGAGALVHPFVLVTLAAWLAFECARRRSMIAVLKNLNLWLMTGLALLPSLLFYGYHQLRHPQELSAAAWGTASRLAPTLSKVSLSEFPLEACWAYSPFILVLFGAGVVWSLRQSAWQQRLLLLQVLAYLTLALIFYQHNSNLVWLTPFASLLSASMLWQIQRKTVSFGLTVIVIAQGILVSLLVLCGIKYGFSEFTQLLNYYKTTCNRCMVLVREGFSDSHLRELQYHFGPDRIVNLDRAELDAQKQLRIDSLNDRIYLYFITSSKGSGGDFDVSRAIYAPVLFGVEILGGVPNAQRFNPNGVSFQKKHPWTYFGIIESELRPSIAMLWIARATGITRDQGRISFNQSR